MNYDDFFERLAFNKSNVLEMLDIIESNKSRLDILEDVSETYRIKITAKELSNQMFGKPNKKVNNENFKTFQELIKNSTVTNNNIHLEITPQKINNPYPKIFNSLNAFKIFEKWNMLSDPKSQLADMSYIYFVMIRDNYINKIIKQSDYIDWLNDNYEIFLGKLKHFRSTSNPKRDALYSTIKDLFN
ncbi:hypothetical protein [Winogradskyella sp.]|jgi:hypothetical protein|uniref:hypothetical protein n=1 Tax=Winogradskyella sp. TaxID=1883156 RepID=UPI0025D97C0B|nr:hypothetical protein [Winogradskyella sp.]MCT4628808.1 hypothetical protein [Winogradskyella sp.]